MSYSDDDELGPAPAWADGYTGSVEGRPLAVSAVLPPAAAPDPYAVLDTVELRPSPGGIAPILAVCTEHQGDVFALGVATDGAGAPLGSLAHMVAEHRAEHHAGPPLCVCPDGSRNEACSEHGTIAQALEAAGERDALLERLKRVLSGAAADYEQCIVAARASADGEQYLKSNGRAEAYRQLAEKLADAAGLTVPDWEGIKTRVPADGVYRVCASCGSRPCHCYAPVDKAGWFTDHGEDSVSAAADPAQVRMDDVAFDRLDRLHGAELESEMNADCPVVVETCVGCQSDFMAGHICRCHSLCGLCHESVPIDAPPHDAGSDVVGDCTEDCTAHRTCRERDR